MIQVEFDIIYKISISQFLYENLCLHLHLSSYEFCLYYILQKTSTYNLST